MATNFRFYLPVRPSLTKKMTLAVRGLGLSNGAFVPHQGTTHHPQPDFNSRCLFHIHPANLHFYPGGILLLRFHALIVIFRFLHDMYRGMLAGCRTVLLDAASARWMAPYFTVAWLQSFILPRRLGGKVERFTAAGSIGNRMQERNADKRAPLRQRLRYIVRDCGAWVHVAVVVLFVAGAMMRVREVRRGEKFFVEMLKAVAWPSHSWVPMLLACSTPIRYAISPPTVPERERLMGAPRKNGVRYAKEEAKRGSWTLWEFGFPQMHAVFLWWPLGGCLLPVGGFECGRCSLGHGFLVALRFGIFCHHS